jgi:hypothetical protein
MWLFGIHSLNSRWNETIESCTVHISFEFATLFFLSYHAQAATCNASMLGLEGRPFSAQGKCRGEATHAALGSRAPKITKPWKGDSRDALRSHA